MKREEYNYWLANINNIGTRKIDLLLKIFGSAEEIFHASPEKIQWILSQEPECRKVRLSKNDVEALIKSRDQGKILDEYNKLTEKNIQFITRDDNRYPIKLKEIYDPPFALYVKGCLPPKNTKVLALVGARDCSSYGKEMARFFAGILAKAGIVIVSGLARGIDSYAHQGALMVDGVTLGVLGCGIDICYPRENIKLYMDMQQKGGIISEYAPGTLPLAGHFPMRNRIISGISDGILVVEAREKSGSLITVDMGLEQGKDVYAIPGRVTDALSLGCNNLIKMGAKLVTTPEDIIEDLLPDSVNSIKNMDNSKNKNNMLETEGKIVYACLSLEPKHIEEIMAETGLSMNHITEQLLLLELNGMVRQTMKNYYVLSKLQN